MFMAVKQLFKGTVLRDFRPSTIPPPRIRRDIRDNFARFGFSGLNVIARLVSAASMSLRNRIPRFQLVRKIGFRGHTETKVRIRRDNRVQGSDSVVSMRPRDRFPLFQ
jgi:hypothetical protein